MKVIFALGNTGRLYAKTRHNVGKIFVEYLLQQLKYTQKVAKSKYTMYKLKPNLLACVSEEAMNISGKAVGLFLQSHRQVKIQDILVVHDDLQSRLGKVRIKNGGSSKGHNGIKSIASQLKTNNIKRLEIGIGRPESKDPIIVSKYVLSPFEQQEREVLQKSFSQCMQMLKSNNYL